LATLGRRSVRETRIPLEQAIIDIAGFAL